ncbi:MAG TPA: hypothetical protein VNZ05_00670 [Solirubrobacteraceae bacterium]|nr:hypothetical protein [Solirubrobacteraceae bacterium]
MGKPPYRPVRELERAIERGELDFALAYAKELARERSRPLDLGLALGLLPLIAAQQPDAYDAWALRWLMRWIGEFRWPTIERAAELAACLADLPRDPQARLAQIRERCASH